MAADKTMLDTVQQDMAERPAAEVRGVDIAAVKAADPGFDDQRFLSACRETLELVRKAPAVRDPRFTDGVLSAQLSSELSWMVPHRGWVATAIQRVGAPDALDPQNV